MSTQHFPMFWLNIQQNMRSFPAGPSNLSLCLASLSACVHSYSEMQSFHSFFHASHSLEVLYLLLFPPQNSCFNDFAKVESRNLGWKSGLCNNFAFVTLANSCGTQGHARVAEDLRAEELIAGEGDYHVLTNLWSHNLKQNIVTYECEITCYSSSCSWILQTQLWFY